MDLLAGLLDGPRARSAFLLRCLLRGPWSIRVEDEAPVTVVVVVEGTAVLLPDRGPALEVGPGDLAVFRGPDHYTVADRTGTAPQVRITPDQVCAALDGSPLTWQSGSGVRTWGNTADDPDAVLLIGTYGSAGEVSQRLLSVLPPVVVVPYADTDHAVVDLLTAELNKDRQGQEAVLDRLLDLVLVTGLRRWLSRPDVRPPGWFGAQDDPAIGSALRLMQHHPERSWTIASLAQAVGMSRAGLARRFGRLVGEPPMTFLTTWRLSLAADLLSETDQTVAQVAEQVGYGDAFALSTAFRRERGISPRDHRTAARKHRAS